MKIPKAMTPQQQKTMMQQKLQKASKMYEEQFLREMVKAMRGTVSHSSITKPSMAEKIYRQQLDEQYVDEWANRGGVGFADLIYNDIVEKYYPQLKGPKAKVIRPMSITDHFRGMVKAKKTEGQKAQTYQIQVNPQKKSTALKLPWPGKVENEFRLPNGQQLVQLRHPQGFRSTFVFAGRLETGPKNDLIGAGEKFAELNEQVESLLWKLEKTNQ